MNNEPNLESPPTHMENRTNSENPTRIAVNKVWEEKIKNLKLYHGSSESTIDYLKKNGISPNVKPYDIKDLKTLDSIILKTGVRDTGYSKDKEGQFYISSNINNACLYAITGPEIFRLHFLSNIDLILKENKAKKLINSLTLDELLFLTETKRKIIHMLNSHKPALLEIDIDAPSMKRHFKETLSDEVGVLYDPKTFEKEVLQRESLLANYGIKKSIDILTKDIIFDLNNQPISVAVPANELGKVIKGEEFYSLSQTTKNYGNAFKSIFFDMEKHPPELINIISIPSMPVDMDKIKATAKYYGFSDLEIGILEERVKKFRLNV